MAQMEKINLGLGRGRFGRKQDPGFKPSLYQLEHEELVRQRIMKSQYRNVFIPKVVKNQDVVDEVKQQNSNMYLPDVGASENVFSNNWNEDFEHIVSMVAKNQGDDAVVKVVVEVENQMTSNCLADCENGDLLSNNGNKEFEQLEFVPVPMQMVVKDQCVVNEVQNNCPAVVGESGDLSSNNGNKDSEQFVPMVPKDQDNGVSDVKNETSNNSRANVKFYQNTPRKDIMTTKVQRRKNIVDLIFEQSIIEYEKNFGYAAARICQIMSEYDLGSATVGARLRSVKPEVTFKSLVLKSGQENFSQCLLTLQDLIQMGENQSKTEILERTFGCLMVEIEFFLNFMNSAVPTTKGSAIFFALAAAEIMNNLVAYLLSLNIYQEIDLKVVERLFLGLKLAGWSLDNFPTSPAAALSSLKFIPLLKTEMDKLVPSIEALVTLMRNRLNGSTDCPQNGRFYMEKMIVILEDLIRLKREKNWKQPTDTNSPDEVDSSSSTPRKSLELKAPTDDSSSEEQKLSEIDNEKLEAEVNKFVDQQESLLHTSP